MLTPVDIQKKVFNTSFHGYNATQVDTFLDQIINDYEALYKDNCKLHEEIDACKNSLKQLEEMEDNIKNTLLLAEKTASEVTSNAEKNVQAIISEAENNARLLRDETETKTAALLQEAETRHAAMLEEAETRYAAMLEEAETKSAAVINEARQQAGQIVDDAQRDTATSRQAVEAILEDARKQAVGKIAEANITASKIISSTEAKVAAAQDVLSGLQQQIMAIHNNAKNTLNSQLQSLDDLIKVNYFSLPEPKVAAAVKDESDYIAYGE